jgi:hypothetical protein
MLLLACATPDEPAPAEEKYEPVPYVVDEAAPPEAALSPEEIEAAIDEAAAGILGVNAAPVVAAYTEAMAESAGCPDYYEVDGSQYWYDECTTDTGTHYSGYAQWILYDGYPDGAGNLYDGAGFYGVGSITRPDGASFSFGGAAYALVATPESIDPTDRNWYAYFQSVVQGGFAYDGPAAAGTWLYEGGAPDLSTVVYYAPGYDGKYVAVDGGVSDLTGELVTAVVMDGVILMSDAIVPDCPGEPAGVVSVRDAEGNWIDVLFHGATEWGGKPDDAALCDGCGEAWFAGEPVGTVCPDFSPLLAWEDQPW